MTTPSRVSSRGIPAPRRGGRQAVTRSGAHPVRLDIQGLRAVAVSLVVLAHAGVGAVGGGYIGVDVFFVVSGFLITSLLLRELSGTGRISIRAFYARRTLRLLPASTLVVLATLAGSWLFLSKIRFEEYAGDALSSALYTVNFRLAAGGTDYLNETSPPSPFQHFWSLAVEEQFYLVWPLLLLLGWRAGRRRVLPAVLLTALCLVSFRLNLTLTHDSPSWGYFASHPRFWELGAGALLALGAGHLDRLPAPLCAAMTWTGLACVLAAALGYSSDTRFPGPFALLPVSGAVLVLAGGCSPDPYGAGWLLARRPVAGLGGLSYGWYLWHWPLLVIGPEALGMTAGVGPALLLCAVALAAAWATLRLVENPVRFHPAFRGRPGRALRLGGGLSAGAAAIALTASLFPPAIEAGRPAPDLRQQITVAADPLRQLDRLLETSGSVLPGNLTPALDRIRPVRSAVYRDGCHVDYQGTQPPPGCVYGDPAASTAVVLFGDSHAAQWFPALDRLARERHWKLVSLTKASCKTAAVTIVYHGGPYTACDVWRERAMARIDSLHPALVLVSSSDAGDPVHPAADLLRQWTDGYRSVYERLGNSGARVAALLDTPWPTSDAVDCAANHPTRLGQCANHLPGAVHDPTRQQAAGDAARSAGASVIDPVPWLCTRAGSCPILLGNTLVYRDDSHLSEGCADALAPLLGHRLTELFGPDLRP
ncbi:acyltransferase family protein [Streptomyces sp. NPDC049040]|uniref:acyltransferase family protein n=1 Tax=Streptomyces sp. NPDC049040 TaxID=3365593 RepID=UPI00372020F8